MHIYHDERDQSIYEWKWTTFERNTAEHMCDTNTFIIIIKLKKRNRACREWVNLYEANIYFYMKVLLVVTFIYSNIVVVLTSDQVTKKKKNNNNTTK